MKIYYSSLYTLKAASRLMNELAEYASIRTVTMYGDDNNGYKVEAVTVGDDMVDPDEMGYILSMNYDFTTDDPVFNEVYAYALTLEDEYASNMPCDNSGYCAGTSCPNFWNCQGGRG